MRTIFHIGFSRMIVFVRFEITRRNKVSVFEGPIATSVRGLVQFRTIIIIFL